MILNTMIYGGDSTTIEPLSVTANGTYTAPSGKAYTPVNVNVPNSYSASDEGKVVSSGALVAQTSQTIDSNGTYDTTLKNEVVVNVPTGGGGGITADDIATRTISGVVSGSASRIEGYAFYECKKITGAIFPNCETIVASAFNACYSLASISFPACSAIGTYAFNSCSSLTDANFPVCSNISNSAFLNCSKLGSVNFPSCNTIGGYAFQRCASLNNISFPICSTIGANAFSACSSLQEVELPMCKIVGSSAFNGCTNLKSVKIPVCETIWSNAFRTCYNLLSLDLTSVSSVTAFGTNAFLSTPIGGYTGSTGGVYGSVFVPASLYSSFLTAQNWSSLANRIVSVP